MANRKTKTQEIEIKNYSGKHSISYYKPENRYAVNNLNGESAPFFKRRLMVLVTMRHQARQALKNALEIDDPKKLMP